METYKMDLVKTPFHSFALINIRGVEDFPLFPKGNVAVAIPHLTDAVADCIAKLSLKHPDYLVSACRDYFSGTDIPAGSFGELLSERMLRSLAASYAEKQREIVASLGDRLLNPEDFKTTPEAALCYIKQTVSFAVWEQVITQHGTNFLPYNKVGVAAIRYRSGELRLADGVGMSNNGHGNFEVSVFSTTPISQSSGPIYPVQTLEVRLKETIKGQGIYDFEVKF